jgi:hypothetical protein
MGIGDLHCHVFHMLRDLPLLDSGAKCIRGYANRICTSLPSFLRIAWKGGQKKAVAIAVRNTSGAPVVEVGGMAERQHFEALIA